MGTRPVRRLKHTSLCHFKCIQTKHCKCFILAWCTLACSTCLPVKATNLKLLTGCLTTGEKYIKRPIELMLGRGPPCPAEQYHTSRSPVGNSEKVPLLSGKGAQPVLPTTSPLVQRALCKPATGQPNPRPSEAGPAPQLVPFRQLARQR